MKKFALGNLQKCVGGFLLYKFWRIFPGIFLEDFSGHFFHKNEEKKSGEKIREKIRRLKNKNPRKIRSAESRPGKSVKNSETILPFSCCPLLN